jgi:hypothetical protein
MGTWLKWVSHLSWSYIACLKIPIIQLFMYINFLFF